MRNCSTCRHWRPFNPEDGPDGDRYCALASTSEGVESGSQAVAWSPRAAVAYLSTEPEFACSQHSYRRVTDREDGE